jgi:hypothetical protein
MAEQQNEYTTEWNSFNAAMAAEGQWELAGVEESEENFIAANQYLIDTGLAWQLQGFFGRQAMSLVEAGHCTLPERGS